MSDLVGFIGLGTMGMPMTANLARAGVALVVHDASPSATEAAGKLAGVAVAASASEVAARASVIFTCLPNDDVVRAVYLGVGGIAAGGSAMGNRVKLVHNGLVAVTAAAVAEALAVCVQSGVDPYTFYDVVRKGGGMAYGTYFERRAKRIFDGEFSPTFMCELMRKDAGLALALAKVSKVPTPILEETKRTYDEAVDSGWGKEDFSAVTHVIEKRIGRKLSRG